MEVLPEASLEGVAIVAGQDLRGSIPGQPAAEEGIGTVDGVGLRHGTGLDPTTFAINHGKQIAHSFTGRKGTDYINVYMTKSSVWDLKFPWFWGEFSL